MHFLARKLFSGAEKCIPLGSVFWGLSGMHISRRYAAGASETCIPESSGASRKMTFGGNFLFREGRESYFQRLSVTSLAGVRPALRGAGAQNR